MSPTQAGLDIFPVTCLLLPGSIVISILTTRTGRFRWALWIGWAISSVACGLLVLFDEVTPTPVWAVVLAVFGIGMGMLLTSINVGIQAISSVQDAGRAAAMYAFMRTVGMSIGVAIGGTTFQNVMIKKLNELGLPEAIAHDSEAYVVEMAHMDPTDPIRIGSLQACESSPLPSPPPVSANRSRRPRLSWRVLGCHRRGYCRLHRQLRRQAAQHGQGPGVQVHPPWLRLWHAPQHLGAQDGRQVSLLFPPKHGNDDTVRGLPGAGGACNRGR